MCPGPAANNIVSPTFTCVAAPTTYTRPNSTLALRIWLLIENERLRSLVKQFLLDLSSNWIQIQLRRAKSGELVK